MNTKFKHYIFLVMIILAGFRTSLAALEFEVRGYFKDDTGGYVAIFNEKNKALNWLKLGSDYNGYKLKDYDNGRDVLIVEYKGKTSEMSLVKAQVRLVAPQDILSRQEALEYFHKFLSTPPGNLKWKTHEEMSADEASLAKGKITPLTDAEARSYLESLSGGGSIPIAGTTDDLGAPVLFKGIARQALPIELSQNLTDTDLENISQQFAAKLSALIGPRIEAQMQAAKQMALNRKP